MKKLIVTAYCLLAFNLLKAQEQMIVKGKIEFERKTNLYKQLDFEDDDSWKDMLKKSMPQYKLSYFDLYFDGTKTLYKPGKEVVAVQKVPEYMDGPANDNIVYNDLEAQTFISQKAVFESVFNIQDSLKKIDWKISVDTRTIAGFNCRKATAIIMDSVYVFAFYTDQIVSSGGPESFTGLPGMILGIALPRLNTTWFATKLELADVSPTILTAPKKGKKTNITTLKDQLKSSMKGWGKYGDKNMWQVMI